VEGCAFTVLGSTLDGPFTTWRPRRPPNDLPLGSSLEWQRFQELCRVSNAPGCSVFSRQGSGPCFLSFTLVMANLFSFHASLASPFYLPFLPFRLVTIPAFGVPLSFLLFFSAGGRRTSFLPLPLGLHPPPDSLR